MSFARTVSLAAILSLGTHAGAAEVDPSSLYDVSVASSTAQVKPGGKGSFVLAVTTKGNAHISDEAPLKLELKGQNVTLEKSMLTRADSVAKKTPEKRYPDPRFEVPFTAQGKGSIEAKLTFFVCTDQLCARQQKSISLPVDVR